MRLLTRLFLMPLSVPFLTSARFHISRLCAGKTVAFAFILGIGILSGLPVTVHAQNGLLALESESAVNRGERAAGTTATAGTPAPVLQTTVPGTPVIAGYRGINFGSDVLSNPTREKPESKLWYNDGSWWGYLWNDAAEAYHIYQFDTTSRGWTDTGTEVDDRTGSTADVLWDGTKLYIVSHDFSPIPGPSSNVGKLFRFSYNSATKAYTLDAGFPVDVNGSKSETLVIDKDSTGKLWITWQEGGKIKVNTSADDGLTWGTPFNLPTQGGNVSTDDISTVAVFDSDRIGLMWSDQVSEKMYFSVHLDGDPDTLWQAREVALGHLAKIADDHINLKMGCDGAGNVYAVTKTSIDQSGQPLIFVVKRDSAGIWTYAEYSGGETDHTRPTMLIDNENNQMFVFAVRNISNKREVYVKSSPLSNISFAPGLGTFFIESSSDLNINNPTTTKQCINNQTGLLVLASDENTKYYLHNYLASLDIAENTPPVISGISDRTMTEEETLDVAITVSDAESNAITLSVTNLPSFATLTDNGNGTGSIRFTPLPGDAGVYQNITIMAEDGGNPVHRDWESFSLTVNSSNAAPVLAAIGNKSVNENSTLQVALSATDANGDALSFSATNLPAFATLSDNGDGTALLTFSPGFADAGSYSGIEIRVTDNGTPPLFDSETITLTVNNVNRAPVLAAIGNQSVDEGATLSVNLSATDPDGDSLFFSAGNLPAFATLSDNGDGTALLTLQPGFADAGTYSSVTLTVSDNGLPASQSDSETITVTVNNVNRAPVLAAIGDQAMPEGAVLQLPLSATDPDGDTLSFSTANLPAFAGLSDNGDGTGTLTFQPGFADAGSYPNIQVTVSDNGVPVLSDQVSFTLTVSDSNRAPVIVAIDNQVMSEGDTLEIAVSASDPDGHTLSLSAANLPVFGTFTDHGGGSGTLRFLPGFDAAGNYPGIAVTATDNGAPVQSATEIFSLTVSGTNRAPVLAAVADQVMNEGDTLTLALSASDPDGDALSFSLNQGPAFAALVDHGNGSATLTLQPGFDAAGTYPEIEIVVTDAGSPPLSGSETFKLTVNNVNRAPALLAIADQSVPEGQSRSLGVSASDPDGNLITLSVHNLPPFASFSSSGGSGTLQFSPGFLDEGSYPGIEVVAVDNGTPALSDTVRFDLTVPNTNRPPQVAALDDTVMDVAKILTIAVSASDPDPENTTIILLAPNLPGFGTFSNNGDGTGMLHFAPGAADVGDYPIEVVALDNGTPQLSDTARFILSVDNINEAPVIAAIPDQQMSEGETLDVVVTATDPDPGGQQIVISTHDLPPFGTFTNTGNGSGVLHFSPGYADAGSYLIEVIAIDNGSPQLADTAQFTLTVGEVNRAPVVAGIADQSVSEGDTLEVAVSASDPDGHNLTLSAQNLPPFGTLTDLGNGSGVLHFSPGYADAGSYLIEVIAIDNGSPQLADTAQFTLTVGEVNRAPVVAGIADQSVSEGDTLEVAVSASDPDGHNLTLSAQNLPPFGTLTDLGNGSGVLRFTPGFTDAGTFAAIEIIATDNGQPPLSGSSAFALTVGNRNRAPLAVEDSAATAEDSTLRLNVLANDSDPDGDSLRITALLLTGTRGTVTFETRADSSVLIYQPPRDYHGPDEFRYVAGDSSGAVDTARVRITITPVNDPPVLADLPDTLSLRADAAATLDIWAAAGDPETPDSLLTYEFLADPDTLVLTFEAATGILTLRAKNVATQLEVRLRITVRDPEGAEAADTVRVSVQTALGVADGVNGLPREFVLLPNYPNPFNPATTIRYGLPQAARVRLVVFNILGQRVATLLDARQPAGFHEVRFDAERLASGIYFYHLQARNLSGEVFNAVRRMVLLK